MLNFVYYKPKYHLRLDYLKKPLVFKLYNAKRLSKVSMLEVFPGKGIQYARSAGCFAKIIKFNAKRHIALLALPSGVKKIFSLHITVFRQPTALKKKRRLANTKSGY
jgi:hypothetical protein